MEIEPFVALFNLANVALHVEGAFWLAVVLAVQNFSEAAHGVGERYRHDRCCGGFSGGGLGGGFGGGFGGGEVNTAIMFVTLKPRGRVFEAVGDSATPLERKRQLPRAISKKLHGTESFRLLTTHSAWHNVGLN